MSSSDPGETKPNKETLTLNQKFRAIHTNASARYERQSWGACESSRGTPINNIHLTDRYATIPSEHSLRSDKALDLILLWYRGYGSKFPPILYYTGAEQPSVKLESRMLARGVSPNWKARWMWLDLSEFRGDNQSAGEGLKVFISSKMGVSDEEVEDKTEDGINSQSAEAFSVHGKFFRLVAMRGNVKIGWCVINLTQEPFTIAGLFDMFVEPEERRRGVGTALTLKALEIAKQKGCEHVFLNSTPDGEPLYRKVGFEVLLDGTTWHLKSDFGAKPVPPEDLVKFLEAICQGDLSSLDRLYEALTPEELQNPTNNNMTPLQIAVHFKQPTSAEWLLDHGVQPDILSLWDLGRKDQAKNWIRERPGTMNALDVERQATPLHIAVERDDIELAEILLQAGCDCTGKDWVFGSTAMGWAEFLGRRRIKILLGDYDRGR